MPKPDLVSGYDKGEFTYDGYDDMVRDYGITLLRLTLVHLLLLIERLKICQCEIFTSKLVRLPTVIFISTLLAQSLVEIGYFAWRRKPLRVRWGFQLAW